MSSSITLSPIPSAGDRSHTRAHTCVRKRPRRPIVYALIVVDGSDRCDFVSVSLSPLFPRLSLSLVTLLLLFLYVLSFFGSPSSLPLSLSLRALSPPVSCPLSFSFPSADGEDYVSHPVFFLPRQRAEYLPLNDFFLRVGSLRVKDIRFGWYAERVSYASARCSMCRM